ncbi:unnamed protein product [Heligmosomoides polygyrus]|uniref:DUF1488 domain-containing protein n=1 Tax=Heligmosomoides polygyrus TaxID=6339 RepID=A0A183GLG6_HELPZ|nr:unnamed protein product [Heligmosomoides polygyrus]
MQPIYSSVSHNWHDTTEANRPFNETGYPFVEVRREHIAGHAKRCLEEFKRQQRYLKDMAIDGEDVFAWSL